MKLRTQLITIILIAWLIFSLACFTLLFTHSLIYREIGFLVLDLLFLFTIISVISYFMKPLLGKRLKELEESNLNLRQEIAACKIAEREYLIHKEHLLRLAHYDPLTNIPNRIYFNEFLNKATHAAKRHGQQLALMLINIDHFKEINDGFGHNIGDLVLKEISNRFSSLLRSEDIIARLSEDEFVVLLNNIDNPKYVGTVAEKLLKNARIPIIIKSQEIKLSISIGIALFPTDGDSLEDLEKHAAAAMDQVKSIGGDNFQYFHHDIGVIASQHLKLEKALHNAIKNEEFVLHYQPQLSLEDGDIKVLEALIRWRHPEYGLLSPDKFIPLAEETGLIIDIGEWVINEACKTNKHWQDAGYDPIIIAVNLSQAQLKTPVLLEIINKALSNNHLPPNFLEVEVTESMMMENVDLTIEKLSSLHQRGIRIAIDDFGTGYTSINSLRQFPLNVLKIDQSFIKGIPHNPNDSAITSAVIALGHNLGLEVVAEGVESTEQIQYLAEHNCDLIQGYFLSRPLPADKIVFQLSKKRNRKVSAKV